MQFTGRAAGLSTEALLPAKCHPRAATVSGLSPDNAFPPQELLEAEQQGRLG
jgi:hypothetical protein